MLTSLQFLEVGQQFPPACESERMKMYSDNRALFEGGHAEIYREVLKRIERVIGNFQDIISYPVVVNYQKLISLKIADLLLGEPPIISAAEQGTIDAIIANSDLINTAYQIAIDVSRYGDGLLYVRKEGDHGIIDMTQPPIWYPIVAEDNVHNIRYHVLAWILGEDKLKVQIHSKGSYEEREYKVDKSLFGCAIGKMTSSTIIQTGLDDFAVIQVSNVITSDRTTGIDDYTDVDSIISDIMVRVGQVDRILDKHASPSMSGPQSALERDEYTGEWRLKAGNFFPRETMEDPDVTYIVWDGQLAANFTQIERLINLLYTISEMGSALFGDMTSTTGQVPSGSALKRLMVAPLAKVARVRSRFNPAMKKAIRLCSQLGGPGIIRLKDADISINWQDGLPSDFLEDSQILSARTANKATISQYRALVMFDGLTPEQAEEELSRIQDDENMMNPIAPAPFANQPVSEPPNTEG